MKLLKTEEAVGHVLCHDITQIIPGVVKDARFRKGHVVQPEDIPVLLSLGKENLYVWEKIEGMLHEDEAAEILRDICLNEHMTTKGPKEGKIDLYAQCDGLFKVDVARLDRVNALEDVMIATRHSNTPVKAGDKLAGTRIIPLVIAKERMDIIKEAAGAAPLLRLLPYQPMRVGVVTTGSEVYHGRIPDSFTPVIEKKLAEYHLEINEHRLCSDDKAMIQKAVEELLELNMDMVLCTGGMSVDPDDRTPAAIKATGAQIVTYGAPVLPGAMFMLAYTADGRVIMGLPGCVMYAKRTIFDLILPRVVCGERVSRADIRALGHGGLCLECEQCRYPSCSFGKGN